MELEALKKEWLKDPEFAREYAVLECEYLQAEESIRTKKDLTVESSDTAEQEKFL
jgi:hypothetical protein